MTHPNNPHDPYAPRPDRNDPDNPARDPNSDIFSSRPRNPSTPTPAPSDAPTYDIIEPSPIDPSPHTRHTPPPLDPSMVAPPPDLNQAPYDPSSTPPDLGPPPLTPPVSPGAMLGTHNGGAILTLGVVSIASGSLGTFCCALITIVGLGCGIAAIIWSSSELRAIDAGFKDPSGRSSVKAGRICGIIGVILASLGLLFFIAMMIFSIATTP